MWPPRGHPTLTPTPTLTHPRPHPNPNSNPRTLTRWAACGHPTQNPNPNPNPNPNLNPKPLSLSLIKSKPNPNQVGGMWLCCPRRMAAACPLACCSHFFCNGLRSMATELSLLPTSSPRSDDVSVPAKPAARITAACAAACHYRRPKVLTLRPLLPATCGTSQL